jgi:CelD/BcsL family acetyltransferase involved in cellulose biosynthesis
MRVAVLKEIPEDPNLSEAWNSLVLAMENSEVFFTYQWALAASRSFQASLSPLLFLVYDFEQLTGIATLAIDPKTPQAASFLTAGSADYCDVVSAPENRREVLFAVLEEIQKLGLTDLVLANVPSNSTTLKYLPAIARSFHFYTASRTSYDCGIVQLGGEEQRETVLRDVTGKGRERRALKKLETLGSVNVIHITEPDQLGASLESIISAQISRFLATDRVSPLVGSDRRAFLQQLSDLLSRSGWLKISQLEIDGRPVAWNYGFRFGGSWFWYLPTFKMEYEQVSPGSCLLRLLVEEGAKDSSVKLLDLGLGDEPYKERFANNTRQTRYVQLSRSLNRHIVSVGRQTLSNAAARFPQLGKKVRGVRTFSRALASRVQDAGIFGTAQLSVRKVIRSVAFEDEVLLFEAPQVPIVGSSSFQLLPLNWDHLVEASIRNAGDAPTLQYLMRCAKRLKKSTASGFILQDENGQPIHFLWIDSYDSFRLAEIDHSIASSSTDAAMIFDCWTPTADRRHGYYGTSIRMAAAHLQSEGRSPWIFCGASNVTSLRGILKAGFVYRFSLVRQRKFGHSVITRQDTTSALDTSQVTTSLKASINRASTSARLGVFSDKRNVSNSG